MAEIVIPKDANGQQVSGANAAEKIILTHVQRLTGKVDRRPDWSNPSAAELISNPPAPEGTTNS